MLLISLLVGCVTVPSGEERVNAAAHMALLHGWHPTRIHTKTFDLVSYVPDRRVSSDNILTVYIEGDGSAWRTTSLPSTDPTPGDPVALKLALKHPKGNAAYLARPCQYTKSGDNICPQRYWTGGRFAPEVIAAESQALDQLKERFGAKKLYLVGYSGGAAVAALLAARRDDVARIITVAGNLDHRAWTSWHKITPLVDSLNPPDYINKLKHIRQWHFAGSDDKVVPEDLIKSFARKFPANNPPVVTVVSGFNHHCCWSERWVELWKMTSSK